MYKYVLCVVDGSHEAEFLELLGRVEDQPGLQAIKALHQQLDDDQDGTIEPSETGDFIKADLKVTLRYLEKFHQNINNFARSCVYSGRRMTR